MRTQRMAAAAFLTVMLFAAGPVMAAGYERTPAGPSPAPASKPQVNPSECDRLVDAIKEAVFFDKYPEYLDRTASVVRDILGQFGVIDKQTP